jgi:hypothetical protein
VKLIIIFVLIAKSMALTPLFIDVKFRLSLPIMSLNISSLSILAFSSPIIILILLDGVLS